jgi:hypothetical protein
MKHLLPILYWLAISLYCTQAYPQAKDSSAIRTFSSPTIKQSLKPEIFISGFIDIINNGQVNASARFIRLFILDSRKKPAKNVFFPLHYPKIIGNFGVNSSMRMYK